MVASLGAPSAGRSDATAALPSELLLKFVSGFTFDELRPLLAVSSRWREIAINSEAYWSSIQLERFTAPGADLFLARLARSGTRPVSLTVDLRTHSADLVAFQDTILTAVRNHLHHINWLVFCLRATDAAKLWPHLVVPAPALGYFSVRVDTVPISNALPLVPENLFSREAPRLRRVAFQDVSLPPGAVAVFAEVTDLCMQSGVTRPMQDILQAFPRLENAILTGWSSYQNPVFSERTYYRNVKGWTWISGRGVHDIPFPLDALRDIQNVTLYNPQPSEILGLVSQLSPPLTVGYDQDIRSPDEEFQLSISARMGPVIFLRTFIDEYQLWSHPPELDFRSAMRSVLSSQVDIVYLNATAWTSFVLCIPPIPSVRWLRIYADETDELSTLTPAALPSPALEKLEFHSTAGCAAVSQPHIVDFVQGSFDTAALLRSILILRNVHLLGDVDVFSGVVKEIHLVHDRPCTMPPVGNDWYTLTAHSKMNPGLTLLCRSMRHESHELELVP